MKLLKKQNKCYYFSITLEFLGKNRIIVIGVTEL